MDKFLTRLKAQAEENPMLAIGAAGGVLVGAAKLLDSVSSARSKRAYAKQVNYSTRKARR